MAVGPGGAALAVDRKAAAYAIANWERRTRFVGDARIPLDNNATERAIRGPVVGLHGVNPAA